MVALSYPGAETRKLRIAGPSWFLLLHIQTPSRCLCCHLVFPHDPYSQLSLLRSGPGHVTAFLGHPISLLTGYPVFISSPLPPNLFSNTVQKKQQQKIVNLILQNGAQSVCYTVHNAFIPWSRPRPHGDMPRFILLSSTSAHVHVVLVIHPRSTLLTPTHTLVRLL